MSDTEGFEDDLDEDVEDDLDEDDDFDDVDSEETELDRTRIAYTGAKLNDEFQPVDEVELAEEGMLLDDPEELGTSAEEKAQRRRQAAIDPDDEGWDLDAEG